MSIDPSHGILLGTSSHWSIGSPVSRWDRESVGPFLCLDITTNCLSDCGIVAPDATSAFPSQVISTPTLQNRPRRAPLPQTAARMLHEIHETSGFTWEQVAAVMSVDVRSVHMWRSGGRVSAIRQQRVLSVWHYFAERQGVPAKELLYRWLISGGDPRRLLGQSADEQNNVFLEETRYAEVGPALPPRPLRVGELPSPNLHEEIERFRLPLPQQRVKPVEARAGEALKPPPLRWRRDE